MNTERIKEGGNETKVIRLSDIIITQGVTNMLGIPGFDNIGDKPNGLKTPALLEALHMNDTHDEEGKILRSNFEIAEKWDLISYEQKGSKGTIVGVGIYRNTMNGRFYFANLENDIWPIQGFDELNSLHNSDIINNVDGKIQTTQLISVKIHGKYHMFDLYGNEIEISAGPSFSSNIDDLNGFIQQGKNYNIGKDVFRIFEVGSLEDENNRSITILDANNKVALRIPVYLKMLKTKGLYFSNNIIIINLYGRKTGGNGYTEEYIAVLAEGHGNLETKECVLYSKSDKHYELFLDIIRKSQRI